MRAPRGGLPRRTDDGTNEVGWGESLAAALPSIFELFLNYPFDPSTQIERLPSREQIIAPILCCHYPPGVSM